MNKNVFLSQVSVIDTETTNIDTSQAEIIEVASGIYQHGTWKVSNMLLGSINPIPPEASATHFISNRMIDGLPRFDQSSQQIPSVLNWQQSWKVAHNSSYDQTVLHNSWLSCGDQTLADQSLDNSRWICTYRLARHLLQSDFPDMKFNLSYLRYRLDLAVPDDLPAHRADSDVITCALLLEFLVDYALATGRVEANQDLGEALNRMCWSHIPVIAWPFGKHQGVCLEDISTEYYLWAMENLNHLKESSHGYDADLAASVALVLEKRLDND